jgi:Tol biopolymer transport system component/predicted Ser/Thr protein kinase
MSPENWKRVEELYHAALERPPEERAPFLADACRGDEPVRREVESLLRHAQPDGEAFLKSIDCGQGLLNSESATQHLEPATFLGPYRVEELLGTGGMGLVYRAIDTRLGREVAVKVSSERFSGRFEREARAAAALNHPHICTLYDVGPNYLVMERVQGETLASRLKKGGVRLEAALQYGAQMAGAIAAAHARGIVHRDLKPGNVMVTTGGIKLLDFGLAQVSGDERLTAVGMVMGTPAYMAPEQRNGAACDARTDVFALGLVLREMVDSGRQNPPPYLRDLNDRCLAEDPTDRWQAVSDVQRELLWIADSLSSEPAPHRAAPRWTRAVLAAFLLGAVALAIGFRQFRTPSPRPVTMFEILPPQGTEFPGLAGYPDVAVSPDGRKIAFPARDSSGKTYLWVRNLDSADSVRLENTEGAVRPFWSPDSQQIGYLDGNALKRIAYTGGFPKTICDLKQTRGATWNSTGDILFGVRSDGLYRVADSGGAPAPLTRLDSAAGEVAHSWPQFLPDGKHFLYVATVSPVQESKVYVQRLGSAARKQVLKSATRVLFAGPESILFVRGQTLFSQHFDPKKIAVSGEPVSVAEGVIAYSINGLSGFSVSDNGVLAFRPDPRITSQLVWYDRHGRRFRSVGAGEAGTTAQFELSKDDKNLALDRFDSQEQRSSFWAMNVSSGAFTRLTFDRRATGTGVLWSPDARRVIFARGKTIYETDVATGALKEFYSSQSDVYLDDWSSDERFVIYHTGREVYILQVAGDRKSESLGSYAPSEVDQLRFSPDGRWLAYNSNESGIFEVYVAPVSAFGQKRRISRNGGVQPQWRKDGRELYYLMPNGRLMVVEIGTPGNLEAGGPLDLFETGLRPSPLITSYAPYHDGQTFVVREPIGSVRTPIRVTLNWDAARR